MWQATSFWERENSSKRSRCVGRRVLPFGRACRPLRDWALRVRTESDETSWPSCSRRHDSPAGGFLLAGGRAVSSPGGTQPGDVVGSLRERRASPAPDQPQHDRLRPGVRVGGDPAPPRPSQCWATTGRHPTPSTCSVAAVRSGSRSPPRTRAPLAFTPSRMRRRFWRYTSSVTPCMMSFAPMATVTNVGRNVATGGADRNAIGGRGQPGDDDRLRVAGQARARRSPPSYPATTRLAAVLLAGGALHQHPAAVAETHRPSELQPLHLTGGDLGLGVGVGSRVLVLRPLEPLLELGDALLAGL